MLSYEDIFIALNKEKVKYLVVGGVAVNLLGYWRATGDLDLILFLDDKNLQGFIKAIKKLKLKPKIPVSLENFANKQIRQSWIKDKNMKAFCLHDPETGVKEVDIVVDHPLNFKEAYKKKETYKDGDLIIPVISLDDLISMKKAAGRDRDKIDINALKRIKGIRNEKKRK